MAKMVRTLQLKRMVANDGERYPAISPLLIHEVMRSVFDAATTVGDRHYPAPTKVAPGKRCVFLQPVKREGTAVLFHAYVYTAGHTPDQVVQDFDAKEPTIAANPIKSGEKEVEVVQRVGCIVLGDALIIENARVYGAAQIVISAMRDLIRRHANPKYPSLSLQDAPNRDFKKLAKAHGGVKRVAARLNGDFTPEPQSFGYALDKMFEGKKLKSFKQVSASIEAKHGDELDLDVVLSMVDESEGSTGLSGITVTFGDDTTLSDLDEYRERYRAEVTESRPGVPHVLEIETALVQYLTELVTSDDAMVRILDSNGSFIEK